MWRTVAVSMGALTAFIGLAFGSAQPSEEVLRAREERRAKAERLAELNAAAEKEREVQAAADLAAAQELLPELTKDWEAERKRIDSRFRTKVDDMEETYKGLKDLIQFDSPPRPIAGRGGRVTVFFKDPDGVELHFVQE